MTARAAVAALCANVLRAFNRYGNIRYVFPAVVLSLSLISAPVCSFGESIHIGSARLRIVSPAENYDIKFTRYKTVEVITENISRAGPTLTALPNGGCPFSFVCSEFRYFFSSIYKKMISKNCCVNGRRLPSIGKVYIQENRPLILDVSNSQVGHIISVNSITHKPRPDLTKETFFHFLDGQIREISTSLRLFGGFFRITSGHSGSNKREETNYRSDHTKPESTSGPFGGFLGSIRSLPLSAKIGITVIFTILAWLCGFVGGIRLLEDPKRWWRYIYLVLASFVLLLSPSVMYW